LDLSKIGSGKFEIIPAEYSIASLINDSATLNSVRVGNKPISFKLEIDENLPSTLIGDELRIRQIFNNLLSNAFKYTQAGSVIWSIKIEQDGDGLWLVSSVKDTGSGIHESDLEDLFSEYNQADTKSTRNIEGTGLGLPIAKSLIELMGGTISVESEFGKGSTFSFRIKQEALANSELIGSATAKKLAEFSYLDNKIDQGSKLERVQIPDANVLVVDDVPMNLELARSLMKPYGMRIDCVLSGVEAIERVRSEKIKYDAIFMDHMMPGMDGIEATRIIREEIDTEYAKTVPIIALTANVIVGNEDMFLHSGFQAFLSKPIDVFLMDDIINRWVCNKEAADEA
jgi:CheY-like chemotaxis protein